LELSYGFTAATKGEIQFPPEIDRDYLVFTAQTPFSTSNIVKSNHGDRWVFVCPMDETTNVDTVMKQVVSWLTRERALDQAALYGNELSDYNITMVRFQKDSFPGVVGQYYFTEFLLAERTEEDIKTLDDLMWLLDRDRMALAMREAMVENMEMTDPAPDLSWLANLQTCCHPAYNPWNTPGPALRAA
jgi:hypothetical protein